MTDAARIEDILRREGVYAAATQGASMYPMLRQGRDTVIIRPPEGRLRKYDVPLYRVGPKYVLHRVVRVLPDGYVIRGDNCLHNERVRDAQIIGVLAGFYRDDRAVDMSGTGYRLYCRLWCALSPLWRLYRRARGAAAALWHRLIPKKHPAE